MASKMTDNLFDLPADVPQELFTQLVEYGAVRIEKIVSFGHASPEGFWYDQDQHEWVVLLKGRAQLSIEGPSEGPSAGRIEGRIVDLQPGDWLNIPARQKHRVEWTSPDEPTLWLAVFYG